MNSNVTAAEVVFDALSAVLGDYAPRKRHLLLDYKDGHGQDRNMNVLTYHNPKATDEAVVKTLEAVAQRRLQALRRFRSSGRWHRPLSLLRPGLPGGIHDRTGLSSTGRYEGRYGEVWLPSYQSGGACA